MKFFTSSNFFNASATVIFLFSSLSVTISGSSLDWLASSTAVSLVSATSMIHLLRVYYLQSTISGSIADKDVSASMSISMCSSDVNFRRQLIKQFRNSASIWSFITSQLFSTSKPHFRKQFLMISGVTLYQVVCSHDTARRIWTPSIIWDAVCLSLTRLAIKWKSSFLYFRLKFLIIPVPRGCNWGALFLARKQSLMLIKWFCKLSGWHVAWSGNRITSRCSKFFLRSNKEHSP